MRERTVNARTSAVKPRPGFWPLAGTITLRGWQGTSYHVRAFRL